MRKRKRQTVKKLIQCVAIIAAGVLAIILFMLAIWYRGKNSEPVTDEQVAAQMQQAEPLVIETPEAAAEGSIRVYDYDGCCIYAYYGKIQINNDGKDGKDIDVEAIEELADSFLHVGQEQPTVLARVNGEYRIIDGHRRNAANILNLERGHKEYEKVLYRFMDMSEAMYELRLLAGNGYTQELTAYEKTRLVERTKAALIRAKEEDGLEIQGKMRDLVAAMINESSTNVARMDAINNNATPEIKEQLKEGNLGITAAYEAAKLDEDEQKEIAEKAAAGENVRAKEIAEKVAEKKAGDDYETPHPESITSLCYSCQKYKDCNVKTGTCQKCDQYINKAEAEKTDEQRYSEEQDAIDRQTKKKLQERADTEKMEHLPSEGNIEHKQHELKIVASYYEDVISGKKSFELRKNDRGYKQGDSLKMLEFKDGKHTGRTIDADIIYMLEDYTGLTEGYCILGIRVTDYTGKVSETDTESGAEHE